MRKLRYIALLMLFSLVLVACDGGGDTFLYGGGEHTHIYGNRYDVTPVTCVAEGTEIRYCKICQAAVTETVLIAADIAQRRHTFSDTVVPPTEAEEGYTKRCCTLCDFVIERANVTPALYALLTDGETVLTPPAGADGILMSDTATHVLTFDVGRDLAVPAEVARRLSVALAITDEMAREGSTLTADTEVALVGGIGAGNSYTVRELLYVWIEEGDPDVARGFAAALDGGEAAFSARVAARLQKLGVGAAATVDPFSAERAGQASLGATAVMIARALDDPLLREAFAAAVPGLVRIVGEKPVLYFAPSKTFRVSALRCEDGSYRFLLVYGTQLPSDIENSIF